MNINPRSAKIYEPIPGVRFLQIIDVDEKGEFAREIPLAAIANRRELLGYDDALEALEAIIELQDRPEPPADPVTGKYVYTDAYQLLFHREEARAQAAALAVAEGCCYEEVVERAEQAAYDAVHQPINGGECAMDRCRRDARAMLGLPDPSVKCGAESRTVPAPVPEPRPEQLAAMRPAGGKALVLDLLAGEQDYLLECSQTLLHQLSNSEIDHISPAVALEPEPGSVILTADELLAKYQEGQEVS